VTEDKILDKAVSTKKLSDDVQTLLTTLSNRVAFLEAGVRASTPSVRLHGAGGNGVFTWSDDEDWDIGNLHDPGSQFLVARLDGVYVVDCYVQGGPGSLNVYFSSDFNIPVARGSLAAFNSVTTVTTVVRMAVGDRVECALDSSGEA